MGERRSVVSQVLVWKIWNNAASVGARGIHGATLEEGPVVHEKSAHVDPGLIVVVHTCTTWPGVGTFHEIVDEHCTPVKMVQGFGEAESVATSETWMMTESDTVSPPAPTTEYVRV